MSIRGHFLLYAVALQIYLLNSQIFPTAYYSRFIFV